MDVTFLTEKQTWGDDRGNGQLQVMKSYGTKTGMSDLAIVLGGAIGSSNKTSDNQLSGYLWSASSVALVFVRTVHFVGVRYYYNPLKRLAGARPALPSSVASSIKPSEARLTRKIGDVQVVEFGEYPQTIAAEAIDRELEQAFSRGQLQKTGKTYTFDGEKRDAYDKPFSAKEHAEYQHSGKRYIRVEAQPFNDNSMLSNGKKPQAGEACWIEVQPIEWLKDPSGVMVARQALFSGLQFDRKQSYDGNFENTDMKQYLQNHFAKEMLAARGAEINEEKPKSTPPIKPIEINQKNESIAREMLAQFGDQITRDDLLKVGRDKKTVLRKIIEGGLLDEALKMLKVGGEKVAILKDALIEREPGAPNSNIEQIAAQGQLAIVFQPEHWTNSVREMQEVWARVHNGHKEQLDGKEGRPSYKRILQEANAASIKALQTGTRAVGE